MPSYTYLAHRNFTTKSTIESGDWLTGLTGATKRSVNFPASWLTGQLAEISSAVKFTSQSLTSAQQAQARANIEAFGSLAIGRELSANDQMEATDFGTIVRLNSYYLTLPATEDVQDRQLVGVMGPGRVQTPVESTVELFDDEILVFLGTSGYLTRVNQDSRGGRVWVTTDGVAPAYAKDKDVWYDSTLGSWFVKYGGIFIEVQNGPLAPYTQLANLYGSSVVLTDSYDGAYIRKAHTSAHTLYVPEFDDTLASGREFTEQFSVTIRNHCAYPLTVAAYSGGVTLYAASGREILAPYETATLLMIEENVWDLI